jgi:hypothetical protein
VKQRPNISIQQKSNTKLEYLKYLATENIQPDITAPTYVAPKGKTKSKPNIKVQTRNLDAINKHRIDMMQYANREFGINPDLLIEYSTYYVLTIITYKLITNNEQPTVKDFDIYCNGLLIDKTTYDVNVNENIVITIQKSEAVDGIVGEDFVETSFEIVSKFDWINITNEEDFNLITENDEDIIL